VIDTGHLLLARGAGPTQSPRLPSGDYGFSDKLSSPGSARRADRGGMSGRGGINRSSKATGAFLVLTEAFDLAQHAQIEWG
jgi:hypothetical protein